MAIYSKILSWILNINIRGSGSGKGNALRNLINHQPGIDKIYPYVKGPSEVRYQFLINKREKVGLDLF